MPIKKEITKIDKDDNDKVTKISHKIKFIDSFRFKIKDNQLIFRCFGCKKNYKKEFNKELIKRFANIYEFCNEDIDKFIFLLRTGVYPYLYMDSWERFDKT